MTTPSSLTQDELKTLVGQARVAIRGARRHRGVGTGSTVNKFIDALASIKSTIRGCFQLCGQHRTSSGFGYSSVFDANEVQSLSVYIDGADEIDGNGNMIKGGGAALTREKSWPPWRSGLFASQTNQSAWRRWASFVAGGSHPHGQ